MPTYVLSYRSPKGYVPTSESLPQWMAWFEGMGDALADIGRPVGARSSVGNCDSASTELGGYSLISAPDLEAAVTIAKGCPQLGRDGGVEVGEIVELPESPHPEAKG